MLAVLERDRVLELAKGNVARIQQDWADPIHWEIFELCYQGQKRMKDSGK
jgi:hypothetical protein